MRIIRAHTELHQHCNTFSQWKYSNQQRAPTYSCIHYNSHYIEQDILTHVETLWHQVVRQALWAPRVRKHYNWLCVINKIPEFPWDLIALSNSRVTWPRPTHPEQNQNNKIIFHLRQTLVHRNAIIVNTWQSSAPNPLHLGLECGHTPSGDAVPTIFLRSCTAAHQLNQFSLHSL